MSDADLSGLIDAVYETAIKPQNYLNFARIWDGYFAGHMLDDGTWKSPEIVGTDILKQHFERALNVFERTKTQREYRASQFLDDQRFAAAVTHLDGSLIMSNSSFDRQFKLRMGQSIYDNLERLGSAKKPHEKPSNGELQRVENPTVVTRYFLPDGQETIIVIEQLRDHGFDDIDAENVLLVKCCYAEWTEIGAGILSDAFGLTKAELEVAKLLYSGLKIRQISDHRVRSLGTVQKQVKSLLAKAQVSNQSDFIRLALGLMHVVEISPLSKKSLQNNMLTDNSFKEVFVKEFKKGRQLQYAHYGHTAGDPVLFLHGHTSSASPSQSLVNAAAQEGLQIIAPCKPGVELSSPADDIFQPMAFIEECLGLLDSLNIDRIPIVGHAMSGVYAIEAAALHPDRFSAVGLFDTGIPLVHQRQFEVMPESSQRIFLAAKNTPELLYAPFAFAAAAALETEEGKDAFVRSQFLESEHDTQLLAYPEIYAAAKEAMLYFMKTPKRSVDELVYWVSDWSNIFKTVSESRPVLFVNSEKHEWLPTQHTVEFCSNLPNVNCRILSETAQLFIYERPGDFCQSLRDLIDGNIALVGSPVSGEDIP